MQFEEIDRAVAYGGDVYAWMRRVPTLPAADAGTYQRHLLWSGHTCEIYGIVWGLGADSGFHPHPEGGCWMRVMSGELTEEMADGSVRRLQSGDTGFQRGSVGIHRIRCGLRGPAISMHVYSPKALARATRESPSNTEEPT